MTPTLTLLKNIQFVYISAIKNDSSVPGGNTGGILSHCLYFRRKERIFRVVGFFYIFQLVLFQSRHNLRVQSIIIRQILKYLIQILHEHGNVQTLGDYDLCHAFHDSQGVAPVLTEEGFQLILAYPHEKNVV